MRRSYPSIFLTSTSEQIGVFSFSRLLWVFQKVVFSACGLETPEISNFPCFSLTPRTIQPPSVLAKAERVGQRSLGNPPSAALNSTF